MNGFVSPYIVGNNNIVYTKMTASNIGSIEAKNVKASVNIPNFLNFNSIQTSSNGVNSSYNSETRLLTITVDNIESTSNKYLILKSNILPGKQAESKLIIIGKVNQYYNTISLIKAYTSDLIYNNELYLNSFIIFFPLEFYSLVGSNSAINLSRAEEATQIEYILTNIGQGSDSYKIEVTPIKYQYDVYIGETFIQTIAANSSAIITSQLLNNITTGDSRYITFKYTISIEAQGPLYATMLVKATYLNNAKVTKTIPTTLQYP